MADREARVIIRAEGDEEVARAAGRIDSAWKSAGTGITGAFKGAAGAVTDATASMLSDLGHVATVAGSISFAGSLQNVKALQEGFASMGVGSGKSIESVQQGINQLSGDINQLPEKTIAWVNSVGQLTYSMQGAAQAAQGMAGYAALTGQSIDQTQGLAVALAQVGGVAGDTTKIIATMAAQAEQLKTVGGVKALGDEFQHLSGQISSLAGPAAKTTALLAGFGGTAGTPMQRERALSGLMGKLESDPRGFERFLRSEGELKTGEHITDKFGHVTDMAGTLEKIQRIGAKGGLMGARLESTFGREAMGLLGETSFGAIHGAEDLESKSPQRALERLKASSAGQLKADEVKKNIAMQEIVGPDSLIGGIFKAISGASAEHPLLTQGGLMLAPKLAGAALKALRPGAMVAEAAGGGGTAAAEGVGGGLLGGLGMAGVAGAGVLGGSVLAAGATLSQLGEASAAKQGFMAKSINEAAVHGLSTRAGAASEAAAANMSPGMRQAMVAEQDAKQLREMIAELNKAGISLKEAQDAAKAQLASAMKGIVIQVLNSTGGQVDAVLRGQQ